MSGKYLVWSNEHTGWWRPDRMGYTQHLSEAGHFTRQAAMSICIGAMLGSREVLNEVPVLLDDIFEMRDVYISRTPDRDEDWM
jgi:hypothetical protein